MGSGADARNLAKLGGNPGGPANNRQVGGKHYRSSMQHWDWVAANDLDYFQGQITKYVARWKLKNGIQDLKKAQHFLQKYIELVEAGEVVGPDSESTPDTEAPAFLASTI